MESSFTSKYNCITRILTSDVEISLPAIEKNEINSCLKFKYKAIWDTGATSSAITEKAANQLGLKPISMVKVNTAGGEKLQNVYLVNIYLPNKVVVPFVNVTECKELSQNNNDNLEVLIGMDVITLGDFSITNKNNSTWLSFRMPSMCQIDYVDEFKRKMNKNIKRNDKCWCGSGKKYKDCHWAEMQKK